MAKILYDGFIYFIQNGGGINRYFANIIDQLPESYAPVLTTRFLRTINFPKSPRLKIIQYRDLPLKPRRIFHHLDRHYHQATTNVRSFDIAHPTYYDLLTHRPISAYKCPVVLTVYDMLHEKVIHRLDPTQPEDFLVRKREAIAAATKIICISESTKRDLMEICHVPEEKITVTYLAAGIEESMAHGDEPVPSAPYFLFVGSRSQYKNFDPFLDAFAQVARKHADIRLCIVGSPFNDKETARIAALGLTERVDHYGFATDEHLAKLYRCCLAFVYPSLYEGFGIPPLEAMICGAIVVAADTSSLPEVVGDAGLLFDPTRVDELTDRLFAIADGSIDRDDLIRRGRERAKRFQWSETVAQTVTVYESLA